MWRLKISITERCSFRCVYCKYRNRGEQLGPRISADMPNEFISSILTAAASAGVRGVHWTGGEPTLRDLPALAARAKAIGFEEQAITTNGSNLADLLDDLIRAGLTRANVSLDTLDGDRFSQLTGGGSLDPVVEGLRMAARGLSLTKVNVVAMHTTVEEIESFIELALELGPSAQLKFLELWEFGSPSEYEALHLSPDTLETAIRSRHPLVPVSLAPGGNPNAAYYRLGDRGPIVGIVRLPPLGWRCGGPRCSKIRVYLDGTTCEGISLIHRQANNQASLMREIMTRRSGGSAV